MKFVLLIFGIAMIGLIIPSVDAASKIYTTTTFRLDAPPTYCTKDESLANPNFSGNWTQLVKDAVKEWEMKLKTSSDYPEFWEMKFLEDTYDCTIPIELKPQLLHTPFPPLGQFNWISAPNPIITLISSAFNANIIFDETKTDNAFTHVLIHEIGHTFGLGHSSHGIATSVMYPLYDTKMGSMGVRPLDVKKVHELYGTYGFYAFSKNKPVGVIDPDMKIVEGIDAPERHQFDFIEISDSEIIEKTDRYHNEFITIKGKVFDFAYLPGQSVRLFMTTPEHDLEIFKSRVSNDGEFSIMIEVTDEFKKGVYRFQPEYATVSSGIHEVQLVIVEKETKKPDTVSSGTISIIPEWIKNNAGWWADGQIDDNSFVKGIQFMIKQNIISIPNLPESSSESADSVPEWIKNNAGWWADGQIDDNSFVKGIEYLVKIGIIIIN